MSRLSHFIGGIRDTFCGPWPLWLRIFLALACATSVVAYATTKLGQEHRAEEIGNLLKAQSFRTLEMLSAGALESVISEDIAAIDTLVDQTTRLDDTLHAVKITNESGQPLISWKRHNGQPPDDAYQFERNIDLAGQNFGNVSTLWDPARLVTELDRKLQAERSRMLAALLALTSLSLFLVHMLVTSPLTKIDNRLRKLTGPNAFVDGGDPLELTSSREIARLSTAVNELGKAIKESNTLTTELEYRASHDYLTGLENRSSFENRVNDRLNSRELDTTEDTLLYFDLDQFKVVNDTCGHAAGDALLQQLSLLLGKQVHAQDIFARLGGDEFAVLLHETPLVRGIEMADKLRTIVEGYRFTWNDRSFSTEASFGAVAINGMENSLKDVMNAADAACYAAKSAGRNRTHVYQSDDLELSARQNELNWVPRIRDALDHSRFILYGQIIEPTKTVSDLDSHIEILVRMLDENDDLIPPGAFLPAAERYGLMSQLDRWVVTHTLEWMCDQKSNTGSYPRCAINLSGNSVSDEQFCDFALKLLKDTAVPGENISFEITETAAVANLTSAVMFMETIREHGCQFALDDFGAGMSSFTYLKNLPVDFIKIDGAFVRDLLNDEASVSIVRSIADISRVMKIKSIAEFVENDAIRSKLREMDIDYVQGYGVGKPQPLADFSQTFSPGQIAA